MKRKQQARQQKDIKGKTKEAEQQPRFRTYAIRSRAIGPTRTSGYANTFTQKIVVAALGTGRRTGATEAMSHASWAGKQTHPAATTTTRDTKAIERESRSRKSATLQAESKQMIVGNMESEKRALTTTAKTKLTDTLAGAGIAKERGPTILGTSLACRVQIISARHIAGGANLRRGAGHAGRQRSRTSWRENRIEARECDATKQNNNKGRDQRENRTRTKEQKTKEQKWDPIRASTQARDSSAKWEEQQVAKTKKRQERHRSIRPSIHETREEAQQNPWRKSNRNADKWSNAINSECRFRTWASRSIQICASKTRNSLAGTSIQGITIVTLWTSRCGVTCHAIATAGWTRDKWPTRRNHTTAERKETAMKGSEQARIESARLHPAIEAFPTLHKQN